MFSRIPLRRPRSMGLPLGGVGHHVTEVGRPSVRLSSSGVAAYPQPRKNANGDSSFSLFKEGAILLPMGALGVLFWLHHRKAQSMKEEAAIMEDLEEAGVLKDIRGVVEDIELAEQHVDETYRFYRELERRIDRMRRSRGADKGGLPETCQSFKESERSFDMYCQRVKGVEGAFDKYCRTLKEAKPEVDKVFHLLDIDKACRRFREVEGKMARVRQVFRRLELKTTTE